MSNLEGGMGKGGMLGMGSMQGTPGKGVLGGTGMHGKSPQPWW